MIVKQLLILALASTPLAAEAQTFPNSGQLLQQVAPPQITPPAAPPDLAVERGSQPPASDNSPFPVHRILIEGNRGIDSATLHALVAAGEDKTLTLAQLDGLAARITAYYHEHGYLLARAMVPAQTLDDGTVRIAVIEARYDQISLDNRSRVNDRLLRAMLTPLRPGDPVTERQLDRALLLLADLPGVVPHATLSPGAEVGTSTLSVQADPGPAVAGTITFDNSGNAFTGRARIGAWLDIRNPLRQGDVLTLGAITAGKGLAFGRLAYQATVSGSGTQLGGALSILDYNLGGTLNALDAHGSAAVINVWASQALVRTRRGKLEARVQFELRRLRDHVDLVDVRDDRHTSNWTMSLDGDRRDTSGINRAGFSVTHGRLGFDDAVAAAADAATARTAGSYTRVNAHFERLQRLTAKTRLSLDVQAQWSGDTLDSSEQFLLGGPQGPRGYDVGVLAGASGYAATMALLHDIALPAPGHTEASLFIDTGSLRIDAQHRIAGPNHVFVHSAGAALNWSGPHRLSARLQLAVPIGKTPGLIDKRQSARIWMQLTKGF